MATSTIKQVLSWPFRTGLSQKQDERWLDQGSMFSATNAVKQKTNTFQKRVGYSILPNDAVTFEVGRGLGSIQGDLFAIAQDEWTDALWTYDIPGQTFSYVDRVPEVYVIGDRTIAANDGVIREMDTAITNGLEIHTWLFTPSDVNGTPFTITNNWTGIIYYCIIDCATGRYLVDPQPMQFNGKLAFPLANGYEQCSPKLIVVEGGNGVATQVIFGCMSGLIQTLGTDSGLIYLAGLDVTQPTLGFGTPVVISGVATPTSVTGASPEGYTMADLGSWNMGPTPDATTQTFGVVWEGLTGESHVQGVIYLQQFLTGSTAPNLAPAPPTLVATLELGQYDTQYLADSSRYITAFGLAIPLIGGYAGVGYAYETYDSINGYSLRVNVQTVNWDLFTLSSDKTAISLMSLDSGPLSFPSNSYRVYPHTMDLVADTSDFAGDWWVTYGPASGVWDITEQMAANPSFPTTQGSAYTQSWWFSRNPPGSLVLVSPTRFTMGVVPASRWMQYNGLGYMICRLVSDEQGTYFLMSNDAWEDNKTGNIGQVSYFPFRLVATFAPRLSSVIYNTNNALQQANYNAVLPYYQDSFWLIGAPPVKDNPYLDGTPVPGNYPHSLPHICSNPNAPGNVVFQTLISISSNNLSQNPTVVQWDMQSPLAYQNVEFGRNSAIATGCPSLTDGARVHEFAFPYFPSVTSIASVYVSDAGPSGGLNQPVAGTFNAPNIYQYIAVYDWLDATGQLHESGRSAPVSITYDTPGPANANRLAITCMGFSAKEKSDVSTSFEFGPQEPPSVNSINIRVYRTQANGSLYYEVGSVTNAQGVYYGQNTLGATVLFEDATSDDQLGTNRLLYDQGLDSAAQGAILDKLTPPAFQAMCVHKNRIFGADGNNVWASQELVDGEGAAFNEAVAFSWYDGSPGITALKSYGDKLILWKRDTVAYVTGEGPEDDGGQNDWSPPQVVSTDTGCIDWRSVVVTHDGVYFMSPVGYKILTLDMVVKPVPDVEDVLNGASFPQSAALGPPVVTSATLHPSEGRVITSLSSTTLGGSESPGYFLNWDYVLQSWTVGTASQDNPASSAASGAVAAAVAQVPIVEYPGGSPVGGNLSVYHFITKAGVVYRENNGTGSITTTYQDGSSYVPMTIETSWAKADGIENFARWRRLQLVWKNLDPHQLSVYVAYDYTDTYYLLGTVTAAQMTAQQNNPICQELFSLPRQRAEAVRFKIVDAADAVTPPVTGQGPLIISMGLEVTKYTNQRTNRLPATQRK